MDKTKNSALQLHWPYFIYSGAIYGSWLSYWSASCLWCKSPSRAASCLPFILSPPTHPSCPQLGYLFFWPHRITTQKQTKLFPTSHLCTRWPVWSVWLVCLKTSVSPLCQEMSHILMSIKPQFCLLCEDFSDPPGWVSHAHHWASVVL